MCGRIVQKRSLADYLERVIHAPAARRIFPPDPVGPRYNVPPGSRPATIHHFDGPAPNVERVFWGYAPENWKRQAMSNARIETILARKWPWNWLMENGGRAIVPADGWYEWKWLSDDPKGPKQPYYIFPVDGAPLLFAALCEWRPGREHGKRNGMAIATNDAKGGMVDVHDRRPIALSADHAAEWIEPSTTPQRAREILQAGLPESIFTWHKVRIEVGNYRYERPDAIEEAV